MQETLIDGYLRRIGARRPTAPGAAALAELHRLHLLAVPFENLSIHLGEEMTLDQDALVDKIVNRGRGGFCYELNGAFAALLTALGYRVEMLAARVHTPLGLGVPYDHLALRVTIPGEDGARLVDVGFGKHAMHPLRLETGTEQRDPGGDFRITATGEGDLDVLLNGEPQYRLEQRARTLDDFTAAHWWHRTSPGSHFTRSLVCSRPTSDGGRVTLSGDRLTITGAAGDKRESVLTADAIPGAYRTHFGIALDRVPTVNPPRPAP